MLGSLSSDCPSESPSTVQDASLTSCRPVGFFGNFKSYRWASQSFNSTKVIWQEVYTDWQHLNYYLWCNMPEQLPSLFAHSQPLIERIDEAGELGQDCLDERSATLTSALRSWACTDYPQPSLQSPTKTFRGHISIWYPSRKKVSWVVTCWR